jgi:hypothetical protein
MALSLLTGYSSSDSGSDSDDDGIKVVIHKNSTAPSHSKNSSSLREASQQGGRKRTTKTVPTVPSSVMCPVMKKRKVMRTVGGDSVLNSLPVGEEEEQLQLTNIPLPSTGTGS